MIVLFHVFTSFHMLKVSNSVEISETIFKLYFFVDILNQIGQNTVEMTTNSKQSNLLNDINFTSIGLMLGAILFVILLLVLVTRYKQGFHMLYRARLKRFKASVVSVNPDYTPISSVWSWDPYLQNDLSEDISYEIDRLKLKILTQRLLGKGEFGTVHEGILFDYIQNSNMPGNDNNSFQQKHSQKKGINQNMNIRVAIKQLRKDAQQVDKDKFITEAKYMK